MLDDPDDTFGVPVPAGLDLEWEDDPTAEDCIAPVRCSSATSGSTSTPEARAPRRTFSRSEPAETGRMR